MEKLAEMQEDVWPAEKERQIIESKSLYSGLAIVANMWNFVWIQDINEGKIIYVFVYQPERDVYCKHSVCVQNVSLYKLPVYEFNMVLTLWECLFCRIFIMLLFYSHHLV